MRKFPSLVNIHKINKTLSLYRNYKGYTIADLIETRCKYDKNYAKLIETVGTKAHQKYVAEERRLNCKNRSIMKELGLLHE